MYSPVSSLDIVQASTNLNTTNGVRANRIRRHYYRLSLPATSSLNRDCFHPVSIRHSRGFGGAQQISVEWTAWTTWTIWTARLACTDGEQITGYRRGARPPRRHGPMKDDLIERSFENPACCGTGKRRRLAESSPILRQVFDNVENLRNGPQPSRAESSVIWAVIRPRTFGGMVQALRTPRPRSPYLGRKEVRPNDGVTEEKCVSSPMNGDEERDGPLSPLAASLRTGNEHPCVMPRKTEDEPGRQDDRSGMRPPWGWPWVFLTWFSSSIRPPLSIFCEPVGGTTTPVDVCPLEHWHSSEGINLGGESFILKVLVRSPFPAKEGWKQLRVREIRPFRQQGVADRNNRSIQDTLKSL
ncbi:hypothetical protein FA13DRAFT_1711835 [Coprinellus micaceus]|uniref:Uncharacterized protein n=1 Tax=Coprinellus micaceus TaxID=71717 RepID=A0A4Y7T3F8_COPMI|nr:hypothetical protein FA13DRAFT_1711835 [Coprinellus micaceus]